MPLVPARDTFQPDSPPRMQVVPAPNASRPFVSFMANDRYYFVHGSIFPEKPLLKQLLGRPLKDDEL